ncbi:prolyl oligopeptidase family serine peptidase [Streptomyces thermolineatus]|uniref:S9 family peptidase n=1 Tax=Streptomyces thermolineatus TaxID=44033 RepID=UPI00384C1D98
MDLDGFPRQFARTRRFSLGVPRSFTVSPDGERVLFLRSASGTDPCGLLWLYGNGRERVLAGPAEGGPVEGGGASAGVTEYAADREARTVAYVLDGSLWTVRTDGGAPRRLPVPGPVADPRPSPDGTLVAYVTGGSLRVVRTDGTQDRPLAEPEGPDVTYGQADHVAALSIGRSRGHWWSPGSDALLVARVDTSAVERRYVGDPAEPGRPPRPVPYPAAGTPNAETSLHLVAVTGGRTPVRLPRTAHEEVKRHGGAGPHGGPSPRGEWSDPAFEYLVTADWQGARPVVGLRTRDQRTVWIVSVHPVTGGVRLLSAATDEAWADLRPGTPLHTASGVPVLSCPRGDARGIRIGDVPSPDGLHVREVLGAVGERVLFTAGEEPTEVHVWSHEPGRGFTVLTRGPGMHTAVAGGGTVVLDSRTPDGHEVTVLRDGRPAGRIAVLAEEPLVAPRPVHLVLGQRELRARIHLPSWYEPGSGGLPVLLSPYSGPGLQVVTRARGWWTAVCQWFAEHGFAVLTADGRGTPGRGAWWERAVLGDRLTPVLEDQVDALHAAAERYEGALDLGRVGIRGWSFGGYLAAGAVLRRPDVFHAAVAGAPPADRRLYDTYWEERFLGHPGVLPGNYERSSLLRHAARPARPDRPARPLMLVHGLADDNVLPAHTLRLSAALLAAGRPHTVLPLSGTGHLVAREGTADALLRLELDFLSKALGPQRPGPAPGPAPRPAPGP